MIDIQEKKKKLRSEQIQIRKKLHNDSNNFFNLNLFEKLFKEINFNDIKIVSSFISIHSEIDTKNLNNYILNKSKILCLPVILKKNRALVFKRFSQNDKLIEGFMKIKEPPSLNDILIPDLLFVPCLAFDNLGYRLGYGGGYYDRTFSFLKSSKKKFISIGYAYDGQKVSKIPKDKFDIKLDYVITEKNIYSYK